MSPTMQPQTTPTSADACLSIVHSLMFYMQGGEMESFSKKAIESLVKKLKEKRDELDSLITAVTSNGARPTKCVTIPRTLDGRLQVAGRKGFPHVIYAKIWRWPDLHKNELKQIKDCQFAFDLKQESVCVNPYHYDRVVCPGIDLSGLTIESSVNIDDYSSCKMERTLGESSHYDPLHTNMMSNMDGNPYHQQQHHHHQHQQQPPSHLHHHFLSQYNPHFPHQLHHHPSHQPMGGAGAPMAPPPTVSYPHPSGPNNNVNSDNNDGINMSQSSTRDATMIGNQANMMGQSDRPSPMEHSASYQNSSLCPMGGATWNNNNNNNINGSNKMREGMYNDCNTVTGKTISYPQNHHHSNIDKLPVSLLPPPEFWCTITYFELDQQVGETFKVPSTRAKVVVDGYTDTFDPNRICLGMLSNVHRTEISERTRRYIGKGIELTLEGEGDIHIKCLSQHPIFIKGAYLDMIAGRAQSKVVHKVHPSISIRAFDLQWCYHQIQKQTATSLANAVAQAAVVAGNIQGGPGMGALTPAISLSTTAGVSVDELRKLCVLHLSFIKGWGPDYPRLNIKQTPCWVEIQLHRPLQLLDELLQSMPMIGHGDQRRRPGMGVMLP